MDLDHGIAEQPAQPFDQDAEGRPPADPNPMPPVRLFCRSRRRAT